MFNVPKVVEKESTYAGLLHVAVERYNRWLETQPSITDTKRDIQRRLDLVSRIEPDMSTIITLGVLEDQPSSRGLRMQIRRERERHIQVFLSLVKKEYDEMTAITPPATHP